jgi:hypothetical protein
MPGLDIVFGEAKDTEYGELKASEIMVKLKKIS